MDLLQPYIDFSLDDDNVESSSASEERGRRVGEPVKFFPSEKTFGNFRQTETYDVESDSGNLESCSSSEHQEASTDEEPPIRRLISKPIVAGKTYTTILYEVIAGMDMPFSIKYFQVESKKPRSRNSRFVIECHLDDHLFGTGEGSSKKDAKQLASEFALRKLVKEFPHLETVAHRVRQGAPSKKKLRVRNRRRPSAPPVKDHGQRWTSRNDGGFPQGFTNPMAHDLADMRERRRFAFEYETVASLVHSIDSLADYVGCPEMSMYDTNLLADFPSYNEIEDYTRTMSSVPERDMYDVESFLMYEQQPDTLDFMRRMKSCTGPSKLNAQAKEFMPN